MNYARMWAYKVGLIRDGVGVVPLSKDIQNIPLFVREGDIVVESNPSNIKTHGPWENFMDELNLAPRPL